MFKAKFGAKCSKLNLAANVKAKFGGKYLKLNLAPNVQS